MHNFICSGDMPAAHVECNFTCDTLEEAMDHFEHTSHSVDERTPGARLEIVIHPYLDRWAIIDLRSPAPKRQQYPYTTFEAAEAALGQLRKAPKS